MSSSMTIEIKARMEQKTTEELTTIWTENDRNEWSDDAFTVIHGILAARGVVIPVQKSWPRSVQKSEPETWLTRRRGHTFAPDIAVNAWSKRLFYFILLLVAIPVCSFGVYALTREHVAETAKEAELKTTGQAYHRCYQCGAPAVAYWYNFLLPEDMRVYVYVCALHRQSAEARQKAAAPVQRPLAIFYLALFAVVYAPLAVRNLWPGRLVFKPESVSRIGPPPAWFFGAIASTLMWILAPMAFAISWQGQRVYAPGSPRRIWGWIGMVLSGLASFFVLAGLIMAAVRSVK